MKLARQDRFYLVSGLLLALSEIWKQLTLTFVIGGGSYQWSFIPFQLCSMPMYICLMIYAFRKTRFRRMGMMFLSDYSLMSGAAAFLDTSGMHYELPLLTLHSYLWHISIVVIGICSGIAIGRRELREYTAPAGIFLACCGAAELINLSFDRFGVVNMFYINPHYYINQIVFSDLRDILPNNVLIVLYIFAAMLAALLVHAGWMMLYNRKIH